LARTVSGWRTLSAADRGRLLDLLAIHLSNYDKLGLKNNTELMVLYRQQTKDEKPFNGPKATKQDVYLVAGKTAWAIEELVGFLIPEITEGQSDKERRDQANLIRTLIVPAYKAGVKAAAAPSK
jgi:hypothetical protein